MLYVRRLLVPLAAALMLGGILASSASASDAYPCGAPTTVDWSTVPVRPCPLTSPLPPNGWIPVYAQPVASPQGSPAPPATGWLHGTAQKSFVCDRAFPNATYYHPSGWHNNWWAYTKSDDGVWGWVPEVFFRGGGDNERDGGLSSTPTCPDSYLTTPPAPAPTPVPPPQPQPDQSCNPQPAAPGLTMDVRVTSRGGQKERRTLTARPGRQLNATGRLVQADGTPLAGASLCVVSGDALAGSSTQPMGTVVTDGEGKFTYKFSVNHSTRVWFVHRVGEAAAAGSVQVRVPAPLSFRASRRTLRNGQSVLLRGRVQGDGDLSGTLAEIQSRRGSRWQTFGTARAGRDGRFHFRYRFTRTTSAVTFRLRAFVRHQRGLPYASGGSRAVRVRVQG